MSLSDPKGSDTQRIQQLSDVLHLPEFWQETRWQDWSVGAYDIAFLRKDPHTTRHTSHSSLTKDIQKLLASLDHKSTKVDHLKRLLKCLKAIHKDKANNDLWRLRALKHAKIQNKKIIVAEERAIAEESLVTAVIEKATQDIKQQTGHIKRSHEHEASGSSKKRHVSESKDQITQEQEPEDQDEDNETHEEGPLWDNQEAVDNDGDDDEFLELLKTAIAKKDKTRYTLFKWAYELHRGKSYLPDQENIRKIREQRDNDIDHLNCISTCLLEQWPLQDDILHQILRLTLSGIVDTAHEWAFRYIRPSFTKRRWAKLTSTAFPIVSLAETSDKIFSTFVAILDGEGTCLNGERSREHEALLYLAKVKVDCLSREANSEELQVSDVLATLLTNIMNDAGGEKTELDCMEDAYMILKIIFRDKKYKFQIGEKSSSASKAIRQHNEYMFGDGGKIHTTHNTIGRKVDMIVSTHNTEISACEWKASAVTPKVARQQESKNMRTNACILDKLANLPLQNTEHDLFVTYMDWIGHDGVINGIRKVGDIYLASKIGNIYIPRSKEDFHDFKQTLQLLYTYKKNMDDLIITLPGALARQAREKKTLLYSVLAVPSSPSSFIFTTPKNSRIHNIFDDDGDNDSE